MSRRLNVKKHHTILLHDKILLYNARSVDGEGPRPRSRKGSYARSWILTDSDDEAPTLSVSKLRATNFIAPFQKVQ